MNILKRYNKSTLKIYFQTYFDKRSKSILKLKGSFRGSVGLMRIKIMINLEL